MSFKRKMQRKHAVTVEGAQSHPTAFMQNVSGKVGVFFQQEPPQSAEDVLTVANTDPGNPSGEPLCAWMSPLVLSLALAPSAGERIRKQLATPPPLGSRWVVYIDGGTITLAGCAFAASGGSGHKSPQAFTDPHAGECVNPAGLLRLLYETPADEIGRPDVRAAVEVFRGRVHATMQADIARGLTPNIDEAIASAGNLTTLEREFDAAVSRGESPADINIAKVLMGNLAA